VQLFSCVADVKEGARKPTEDLARCCSSCYQCRAGRRNAIGGVGDRGGKALLLSPWARLLDQDEWLLRIEAEPYARANLGGWLLHS
jgi:hypothetical protein